jgi:hypothetical protein
MPLSDPSPRKHLHTRRIECTGYQREDGLWDIEGHLVDTKTYGFANRTRGQVTAGTPIHDMWIRLTIDGSMRVHRAEAKTDASPYPICAAVNEGFRELEGLTIGPGWMRSVVSRIGGVLGCTHLVELLRPLATTAYQSMYKERRAAEQTGEKPVFLDTCYALSTANEVVKEHWPQFYTGTTSDRSRQG